MEGEQVMEQPQGQKQYTSNHHNPTHAAFPAAPVDRRHYLVRFQGQPDAQQRQKKQQSHHQHPKTAAALLPEEGSLPPEHNSHPRLPARPHHQKRPAHLVPLLPAGQHPQQQYLQHGRAAAQQQHPRKGVLLSLHQQRTRRRPDLQLPIGPKHQMIPTLCSTHPQSGFTDTPVQVEPSEFKRSSDFHFAVAGGTDLSELHHQRQRRAHSQQVAPLTAAPSQQQNSQPISFLKNLQRAPPSQKREETVPFGPQRGGLQLPGVVPQKLGGSRHEKKEQEQKTHAMSGIQYGKGSRNS